MVLKLRTVAIWCGKMHDRALRPALAGPRRDRVARAGRSGLMEEKEEGGDGEDGKEGEIQGPRVRLVPLGQTDGQVATAALLPAVEAATEAGLAADLDRLGTTAPVLDLFSLRHETQYTRLFRS